MTDLEQLAERCEQASGPDRELDAEIAIVSGLYVKERRGSDRKEWFYPTDGKGWRRSPHSLGYERLPSFTGSIDGAMTLVPSDLYQDLRPGDWWWSVDSLGCDAHVAYENRDSGIPEFSASASTPALALCAAALRARSDVIAANRK